MESNFHHFAKVIDGEIYSVVDKRRYTLRGLQSGGMLQYQNGSPELHIGPYTDFRICVENEDELQIMDIPENISVKVSVNKVIVPLENQIIVPSVFLNRIMDIIYSLIPGNNIDHGFMLKNFKSRKRELVEARQVVMASYYNAFANHKRYPISLTIAGNVYYKDHATVIHAVKTVSNLIDTDPAYVEKYSEVWRLIEKVQLQNKEIIRHENTRFYSYR